MRNENGYGSIICLDKTGKKRRKPWAVRITTGWKDGKQVRKYLGYYRTQREALIALADYHKSGLNIDLTNLTLEEVFDRWYARVEQKASKTVLQGHNMARTRLGVLGKKQIKEVRADHIEDWINSADLKQSTKHRLKSTLSQVFEYAEQNDIVQKNPVKFVKLETANEKVGHIFSDEEIQYLWEHADDHVDYKTLLILIYSGMRIGELLKVRAEDINLEEQYLIGGSKSDAGKDRVIPLHDKIMPIVKERIEKYGFLAPSTKGSPTSYVSFNQRLTKHMEELNWEHKSHDTRKTAISLMHRYEVPMEVIRMIVGHSGKGVTEKVYIYKSKRSQLQCNRGIDIYALLFRNKNAGF
jgi:integrase